MKKCLMIKDEQTVKVNIQIGTTEIENIEYFVIKCPNCKTQIFIPTCTVRTLLTASKKKLVGVV